MSSIMRRRSGLMPSFVIAKAPVCCVVDSQTQPDRQVASLYKRSAPLSTGITDALSAGFTAERFSSISRVNLVYRAERSSHSVWHLHEQWMDRVAFKKNS